MFGTLEQTRSGMILDSSSLCCAASVNSKSCQHFVHSALDIYEYSILLSLHQLFIYINFVCFQYKLSVKKPNRAHFRD